MKEKDSSENHQVNNLKVVIDLAKCLGATNFYQIEKREQIISYLNKKMDNDMESLSESNEVIFQMALQLVLERGTRCK